MPGSGGDCIVCKGLTPWEILRELFLDLRYLVISFQELHLSRCCLGALAKNICGHMGFASDSNLNNES